MPQKPILIEQARLLALPAGSVADSTGNPGGVPDAHQPVVDQAAAQTN